MREITKKQLNYWESLRGRKLSKQTKRKMSEIQKKITHSGRFKKGCKINLGRKRIDMIDNRWGFKKGQPSWNKGEKLTEEHKQKLSKAHIGKPAYWNMGEKSACWKGDDVGYGGVHCWVRKYKGKPKKCEMCGLVGKRINKRWNIEWANKNHKYKRNLDDYIGLCCKCHQKYDIKYNNLKK